MDGIERSLADEFYMTCFKRNRQVFAGNGLEAIIFRADGYILNSCPKDIPLRRSLSRLKIVTESILKALAVTRDLN